MSQRAESPHCKLVRLIVLALSSFFLLQGCIPVASGVISYSAAVSSQEHSAYADYISATQQANRERSKAQEMLVILTRDKWLADIHQPLLDYADYVDNSLKTNAIASPVMPYDEWKATEYKKLLAQRAEAQEKGRNQSNLHR